MFNSRKLDCYGSVRFDLRREWPIRHMCNDGLRTSYVQLYCGALSDVHYRKDVGEGIHLLDLHLTNIGIDLYSSPGRQPRVQFHTRKENEGGLVTMLNLAVRSLQWPVHVKADWVGPGRQQRHW